MNHRGIWVTAAVLAVVVLLAQIAGASTSDVGTSAQATTAATVSLSAQASSVAQEKSAAGMATANAVRVSNESASERGRTETTETNEVTANAPAAAPHDSTTGARPGWGCGDKNHTHSGPPGRPGATPPPGCSKP